MRRQVAATCSRLLLRELAGDASAGLTGKMHHLGACTAAPFSALSAPRGVPALPPLGIAASTLAAPFSSSASSPSSDDEDDWRSMNTVLYPDSELEVGSPAPPFAAPAVVNGEIVDKLSLSDYKGKYVVLFFFPKAFTYVCPTEIIAFNDRAAEFEALGAQLIAASTDTAEVDLAWIKTPRKRGGLGHMEIPMLADVTKSISARYGVLLKDAGIALRGTFIIDDAGVVQHATINSLGVGRSVDETLRTLQAVQFVAEHGEVCPAGWNPGDKGMIADPEQSLDYFESAASSEAEETKPGAAVHAVADKREFNALVAGGGKVVAEFWAPWCGKCKQLAPFVNQLAERHAGAGVTVAAIDTTEEKLEGLAEKLGAKGLPAFLFYAGGKEVAPKIIGYKKQKLEQAVEELAKM